MEAETRFLEAIELNSNDATEFAAFLEVCEDRRGGVLIYKTSKRFPKSR